ncbi:MAG: BON domain-containing protein [Anaerolineales bacterium]|nr:BON domain-containing protein [Anaerolineales bacterium]
MTIDEKIKKDVTDQLYWDHRVDAADVQIEVDDGIVTLIGSVPSFTAKDAAYDDSWFVDGVPLVVNDLDVEYVTETKMPADDEIQRYVVEKLRWNPDLASYKIDVSVSKGWVTLEGAVDAYWKKVRARMETSEVIGVLGVSNKLAVVPTESIKDERIAEDVVAAMDRHISVNPEDVNVRF